MAQQSIYNIIPKEFNPPSKSKLYRSNYPSQIPPTGSTFGLYTTSKNKAANLSGEYNRGIAAHTEYGQAKTFGHLKNDRKPKPDNFLKSKTGTMGNQELPPIRNFSYDCNFKKENVPCVHEKPVQGQKSDKNFIVTNAITNILSTAKKLPQETDWTKKVDYGRNPDYLQKVKDNIQKEYTMIQNLHQQYQQNPNCLTQEQVSQLREGLKKKWSQLSQEYQKKTYVKLIDTLGLKNRKEGLEKQMAAIEADIKKLNKLYIFIE